MKLLFMTTLLIISLLSGCAFIQGWKDQSPPIPKTKQKPIESPAPAPTNGSATEAKATTGAAKMLSPITH
jgi:hypothetical protein